MKDEVISLRDKLKERD